MSHITRSKYFLSVLRTNPSELFRLAHIGWTTFKYRYIKHCIGKGTIIEPNTRIINSANVFIGMGCLIKESVYIRAGKEGRVTIHDGAAINSFCQIYGHGGVEIGEDAQIGPGCIITTTDHDMYGNLKARFKRVTIGRRVWIGANVTILPGVTIGDYTVIGAGSVVTKAIPSQCVAVGVPTKVIREFTECELN